MEHRFCRICWNTAAWRYPTGDATRIETKGTYASDYGFGHEEWLFNFEWIIEGYRYSYVQPMAKYSGSNCTLLLYTFTPEGENLIIGTIKNVYVPTIDERASVVERFEENGWMDQMCNDIDHVGGNVRILNESKPEEIVNIRFAPEDVETFDPRPRIIGDHVTLRSRRYIPFKWSDNNYPCTETQGLPTQNYDPRRSEHARTRAAQEGNIFDPRHIRLQNLLYKYLCNLHGSDNVFYEKNYVDLMLKTQDGYEYFEIKMETTAKRCIRLALGQLLEYAHYPNCNRAIRLIVVGDAAVTESDALYLSILRNKFSVPIYYARFDWETGTLDTSV